MVPCRDGPPARRPGCPSQARRYRPPGGPWDVPTLDALISAARRRGGRRRRPDSSPAAMDDLVARVAGGLRARGVRKGEAVAWQVPNSLAAAVLTRACWRIGRGGGAGAALVRRGRRGRGARARSTRRSRSSSSPTPSRIPTALADALGGAAGAAAARSASARPTWRSSCSPRARPGTPKAVLHTHRGPELEGVADGAGPRPGRRRRRAHAGADGPHLGPAQRGPRAGRGRPARRAGPPLRPRARRWRWWQAERISFLAGPPTFFVAMASALARWPGTTCRPSGWSRAAAPR